MEGIAEGISFKPVKGVISKTKNEDKRDWVDKMFLDFDKKEGKNVPIDVCVIDGSNVRTHNQIELGRDNITIIQNLGSNLEGKFALKDETLVVLGGNRFGRSGAGRVAIPLSQYDKFIEYAKAVKNSIENQLEGLED